MENQSEHIRLNLTSRLILGATAALGLALLASAAPSAVSASGRAPLVSASSLQTLSSAPGISLARAQGSDDEDCVRVTVGGSTPNRLVCAE
ncbi:MAG: hypothetical protein KGM42_06285 [Hyphomicrobiales bacterium]|nr:hypothetical protein [Hyphomicrobiales bacterium]